MDGALHHAVRLDIPAVTPEPPYTAVIFTSVRTEGDAGYAEMSQRMVELASRQPGFLGVETARDELGITVSYWETAEHARAWKKVAEHRVAQREGKRIWYSSYRVRIATVEREYGRPHSPDLDQHRIT